MAEFAVLIQKYFSTYIDECNIYAYICSAKHEKLYF